MNALANQVHLRYQRAQVEAASPGKLIVMLYDGAIRKLIQAAGHLEEGRHEEYHVQVVKVQRILTELLSALDHEKGGEIAANLYRLYEYMIRRLTLALLRKDVELITETRGLLEELREAWVAAVEKVVEPDPGREAAASTFMAMLGADRNDPTTLAAAAPPQPALSLNIAG
ncbi:MAG: flagellar export chaperone FliS [Candidatus Omnitrophica bacterium]|nr:hypothetical protein [bacterium]NUN96277.1 flagellar export chaperone FliS [Candidatus Omnitrophota bacterium]